MSSLEVFMWLEHGSPLAVEEQVERAEAGQVHAKGVARKARWELVPSSLGCWAPLT